MTALAMNAPISSVGIFRRVESAAVTGFDASTDAGLRLQNLKSNSQDKAAIAAFWAWGFIRLREDTDARSPKARASIIKVTGGLSSVATVPSVTRKTEARVNMKLRRKILTAKLAAHKETPFAYDSASGITLIEFFRHPSNLTCAVSDEGIRMLWSNLSGETESEFIAYEDSLDAVLPLKISKILGL
jgi:hypothetical protein